MRPSFLGELLNNLNLGSFTLFVEQFLAEYDLESQAGCEAVTGQCSLHNVLFCRKTNFWTCVFACSCIFCGEGFHVIPPKKGVNLGNPRFRLRT